MTEEGGLEIWYEEENTGRKSMQQREVGATAQHFAFPAK
jgi:hypothetical protein